MPWYDVKDSQGKLVQRMFAQDEALIKANTPAGGTYSVSPKLETMVETVAETISTVEDTLLARVDAVRSEQQMRYLTRGTSLSLEYVQIQVELRDYKTLLPNVLGTLTPAIRQARWPIASMEAELSGKTLPVIFAAYEKAINENEKHNRVTGRIAVVAKERIRAATTIADKRKAFSDIKWDWMPSF